MLERLWSVVENLLGSLHDFLFEPDIEPLDFEGPRDYLSRQ